MLSSTGFVGRISYHLRLRELPLDVVGEFWSSARERVSSYEKLKILAVTGGVPRYLESVNPKVSTERNIELLCFRPGAMLLDEFERLFSTLFLNKTASLKGIVKALVNGSSDYQQLSKLTKRSTGGALSEDLKILTESGFVAQDLTYSLSNHKPTKKKTYRLADNYLRFYLKYIEPVRARIEQGVFGFKSFASLQNWESILGLQFENLILNNKRLVLERVDSLMRS